MRRRILSTTILIVVLLSTIKWGGFSVGVGWICAFSLLTQYELNHLLRHIGYEVHPRWHLCVAFAFPLLVGLLPADIDSLDLSALFVTVLSVATLVQIKEDKVHSTFVCTLFSFIYVPFNFHFLILIVRHCNSVNVGLWTLVWLVAVAKATDIGGLLVGLAVGRHPFAPKISPKKTWEGVCGGVLTSAMVSTLMGHFLGSRLPVRLGPARAAFLALPLAFVAIASDLLESQLKRMAKVKDSGSIVPGIGGVLDLTDSLLLTSPVGFLLFKYCLE
jgi:phosphatidate cytidylyltransferase